jgi:tetratricopeptide (TPR) repeat protein
VDLHLFAAVTTCLLADTSASAGFLDLADQQAQAAVEYAGAAGHDQLRFWVDGNFRSSLANWRGAPQSALERLVRSRSLARGHISELQFANSKALYLARLGRRDEALEAIGSLAWHREEHDGQDHLYDEIGGMFAYPEAKQEQVLAQTYIYLGEPAKAEESAGRSLELYQSAPATQRAFGNEAAATIDLAHARLELGNIEAASASLQPIFDLPPRQRQQFVVLRLVELRDGFVGSKPGKAKAAKVLVDQIATFTAETANDVISIAG